MVRCTRSDLGRMENYMLSKNHVSVSKESGTGAKNCEKLRSMRIYHHIAIVFVSTKLGKRGTVSISKQSYVEKGECSFNNSQLLIPCLLLYSLAQYADSHGRLPERKVWSMLVDLLKVHITYSILKKITHNMLIGLEAPP